MNRPVDAFTFHGPALFGGNQSHCDFAGSNMNYCSRPEPEKLERRYLFRPVNGVDIGVGQVAVLSVT
jgi:hypothetical protein